MARRGYSGRTKKSVAGRIAAIAVGLFVLLLCAAAVMLLLDALVFTADGPVLDLSVWFPMQAD